MTSWVKQTLRSSIGLKLIMALSGIVMVSFLVAHIGGNLLIFGPPDLIDKYSAGLRNYMPVLWFLRIGLAVSVILHIVSGIYLTRLNQTAKPDRYAKTNRRTESWAARSMFLTGSVILAFILYHLAHLTFRWTHADAFAGLGHFDVRAMLIISFRSLPVSGFYVLSVILLMFHLNHGITSFFQTLGINARKFNPLIRTVGPALTLLLGAGFISIPLAILFGLIQ